MDRELAAGPSQIPSNSSNAGFVNVSAEDAAYDEAMNRVVAAIRSAFAASLSGSGHLSAVLAGAESLHSLHGIGPTGFTFLANMGAHGAPRSVAETYRA